MQYIYIFLSFIPLFLFLYIHLFICLFEFLMFGCQLCSLGVWSGASPSFAHPGKKLCRIFSLSLFFFLDIMGVFQKAGYVKTLSMLTLR